VSLVACGIRDASGKVIGLSTIMRDITDRKRAERETALLATVVNSSDDAIISVTPDSKIITWNPAAERIYGYTAEEAIGRGVDLFVPREELGQSLAAARHVAETGQAVSWEQKAYRRDGTPFISAVNIFPIRDAEGNVVSVTGIGRDITRLKETEKEPA
jgi:PAS domain S-box-containing protein